MKTDTGDHLTKEKCYLVTMHKYCFREPTEINKNIRKGFSHQPKAGRCCLCLEVVYT